MSGTDILTYEVEVERTDGDDYRKLFAGFDDAYAYFESRVDFFDDDDGAERVYRHNRDNDDEVLSVDGDGFVVRIRVQTVHFDYGGQLYSHQESIDLENVVEVIREDSRTSAGDDDA